MLFVLFVVEKSRHQHLIGHVDSCYSCNSWSKNSHHQHFIERADSCYSYYSWSKKSRHQHFIGRADSCYSCNSWSKKSSSPSHHYPRFSWHSPSYSTALSALKSPETYILLHHSVNFCILVNALPPTCEAICAQFLTGISPKCRIILHPHHHPSHHPTPRNHQYTLTISIYSVGCVGENREKKIQGGE